MARYIDRSITLEDVTIVHRNFRGAKSEVNLEGHRGFSVLIDDETAKRLEKEGWNVKRFKVREEGDDPQAFLPVFLKYRARDGRVLRPPRIVLITGKNRTQLEEEDVSMLDWADIMSVDLTINPSEYEIQGRHGIKAYLRTMFVTIQEDYLERKYSSQD